MAKKTIVGEVAGTVTDAVASAIDALAHPLKTATQVRKAMGRAGVSTKRKVTTKKKAARKAARKAASKTKRTVSTAASRARRAVTKTKQKVRRAAKKAAKKARGR